MTTTMPPIVSTTGDRVLWHGTFLDARLTFILPTDQASQNPAPNEIAVIVVAISAAQDVQHRDKLFIHEPFEANFAASINDIIAEVEAEYMELVMLHKQEILNHGPAKLH